MAIWTDTRVALLKELCAEKLSCAQISQRINDETGSRFSRNAVIGKISRCGFEKPFGAVYSRHDGTRIYNPKRKRVGDIDVNILRRFKAAPGPELPIETPPAADFLGLPFDQLDNSSIPKLCRYPRGEGPYLFCGQPTQEGSSYCPACHRMAYHRLTPHYRKPFIPARVA